MVELSEAEKSILRDVAMRHQQGQENLRQAQAEVQRRAAHLEAVVNTVTRLKGLDPDKYTFAYDLGRELFELRELPQPDPAPALVPTGEQVIGTVSAPDGPGDIKAALALAAQAARVNDPGDALPPSEPELAASAS